MKRILALAGLLAVLTWPAMAGGGFPLEVETCDTWQESQALARGMASRRELHLTILEGSPARNFIKAISSPDSKVVLSADRVIVLADRSGMGVNIWLADDLCGGTGSIIGMRSADLPAALLAARKLGGVR